MLSPAEAKQFYDQFGAKQDEQDYYEGPALEELFKQGSTEGRLNKNLTIQVLSLN